MFIERKYSQRKGFVGISRPGFQINAITSVVNDLYISNDKLNSHELSIK